jgi:hypothetical protein
MRVLLRTAMAAGFRGFIGGFAMGNVEHRLRTFFKGAWGAILFSAFWIVECLIGPIVALCLGFVIGPAITCFWARFSSANATDLDCAAVAEEEKPQA